MKLVLFEKINVQGPGSQDLADLREEIGVFDFAVGVDVDDGDLVLDSYGRWALGVGLEVDLGGWGNKGTRTFGCEDVLDTDWDRRKTLLYCEMMDYFGAIEAVKWSA